jgi:hypothetical protein
MGKEQQTVIIILRRCCPHSNEPTAGMVVHSDEIMSIRYRPDQQLNLEHYSSSAVWRS